MWGRLWRRLRRWLPEPETLDNIGRAWRRVGALLILLLAGALFFEAPGLYGLLGTLAIIGLLLLVGVAAWLILYLFAWIPPGARWGLLLLAIALMPFVFVPPLFAVLYGSLVLLTALLGVGVSRIRQGRRPSGWSFCLAGGLPLLALSGAFLLDGWDVEEPTAPPPMNAAPLALPDPAATGGYRVLTRSYGSGTDRRPEYGSDADWTSEPVDASRLLDGWEGLAGWSRTGYWGVSADSLPLQGRVWLPDGPGPFPLVLIVHGNHEMSDFSDTGYAYLGELFASRGILTVSVDENFLNSSVADLIAGLDGGLEEESDARAWLLLQHLAAWRRWSADPDHAMYGKADLDRVVLIGHSRGGEAVSEAVVFNRLPRYPDDGTLAFDFGFGILGVIAIAPVDAQYNPRDRPTAPRDVSYLVIHGSHDADVNAYVGSALYSRLEFVDCGHCFKAGLYLLNANHGQFNTSWGEFDVPSPLANLLNVAPLMDAPAQRRVAEVLFSAFLEVVLEGREEYRAFLARPERGARWLPDDVSFLSVYRDARQVVVADFEEDEDLDTATIPGAVLRTEGLSLWKEAEVPLRWEDTDTAAVLLGWQGDSPAPVFDIVLSGSAWLTPGMTLSVAAAMANESPGELEGFEPPAELDFDIELEDRHGNTASVALSERRPLFPQVDPVLYKLDALDQNAATEVVFQRFAFPIAEWRSRNPALDVTLLRAIRFRFPDDVPASVWLDDVLISPDGL